MNVQFTFLAGRSIRQLMVYAIVAVCSITVLLAPPASAHELKTDGVISATLHFEPDDDPASGKPTEYTLFLNDSTKHFSFGDCDCTISIKKDSKILNTKPMQLNSQNIINGSVSFPKDGTYEVIFQGSPTKGGMFQPFILRYPQRVLPNANTEHPPLVFAICMGMLVVGLVAIAFLIKVRSNNLKAANKEKTFE